MRAVGIEHIIVCINKMDIYNYDEEIYKKRCEKINSFITKIGFKSIDYIMTSAFYGKNLLELLDKIIVINEKLDKTETPVIEKKESKLITAQIKLINLDTDIIAPGYECVCHIKKNEYQVVIDDLRQYDLKTKKITNKKFAKVNDIIFAKIKLIDSKKYLEGNTDDKIIIRRNDSTVGFGKITKC